MAKNKAKTKKPAKTKTPKTQAKKTKTKDQPLMVAQVKAEDGTIFEKQFTADNFPVAAVIVKMFAPKTPYHNKSQVLCWSSKLSKCKADTNRVKRLYIDEKGELFTEKRYTSAVLTEQIKTVTALKNPEDRSAFKAAKVRRGEIVVKTAKVAKKEKKAS